MTSLHLSVPGKTFLLGEYLALAHGPAILLCTAPRFELIASPSAEPDHSGIHPESPAGKFIAQHPHVFEKYSLRFIDPYKGLGGLGASSAQFALCYALLRKDTWITDESILEALTLYREVTWDEQGIPPSGADVVAQLKGGLCYFNQKDQEIESLSWPFADMDFCLIHTGKKMATHNHLHELGQLDTEDLEMIVNDGLVSLRTNDSNEFIKAVNQYASSLKAKQFVAQHTAELLDQIHQQPGVLAAKGCGAMGADIVLVLLKRAESKSFAKWVEKCALRVITLGSETSEGLKIESQVV